MWVVPVPISVPVSKSRRFQLNLNEYRNAHYQTLNKAKIKFTEEVLPRLSSIPVLKKVRISYILYPPTARLVDTANICSIVDKFFSDTLVAAGKIMDDNYTCLEAVAYAIGEIDRSNPRVDVVIEPLP